MTVDVTKGPIFCEVCHDVRMIKWAATGAAYPCPYCGQFTTDPKQKLAKESKRYGNPFILDGADYEKFKAHRRLDGFKPYPTLAADLTPEEKQRFRSVAATYPAAAEKFCLMWARYQS